MADHSSGVKKGSPSSMGYSSVPAIRHGRDEEEEHDDDDDEGSGLVRRSNRERATNFAKRFWRSVVVCLLLIVLVGLIFADASSRRATSASSSSSSGSTTTTNQESPRAEGPAEEEDDADAATETPADDDGADRPPKAGERRLPMPRGVNLGSWLSLEDYFYAGPRRSVEVATPDGSIQGSCLPPLHVGKSTGPMWHSETDLFGNLTSEFGVKHAVRVFAAHRAGHLDWDEELSSIAGAGMTTARVPISWCLTEFDPTDDEILMREEEEEAREDGDEEALLERYSCVDPFVRDDENEIVRWPAIPKPFLTSFLRACSKRGLKVTLDAHTHPGGTSLGTFSGVWPRKPLFWKHDDPSHPETDLGRSIFKDLVSWLEELKATDPDAFKGLGAVTPMNEPAHLAGLFGPDGPFPEDESFVPPLPREAAAEYLSRLDSELPDGDDDDDVVSVSDGNHLRVLLWLSDAIEAFRSSSLPPSGIELHMNVHESVLTPSSYAGNDGDDPGGRHPHGTALLAAWWGAVTDRTERETWAVLDMHHYHAWEPNCQGSVLGPPSGDYACLDGRARTDAFDRCSSWAKIYRSAVDSQVGHPGSKLTSGEFSASTHHSVRESCVDVTTRRESYLSQTKAAREADVDLTWWSWKMPHGGSFRAAWSFKQFLYEMRQEGFERPDESPFECGEGFGVNDSKV